MAPLLLRPAATPIDWEIIKGESFDIRVPVLDAGNQPVDVTGWTATAQVRRSEDEPLLHEWSADASNIDVDGTDVVLTVDGAATSLWAWTDALVSIEVYEPAAPDAARPHVIAQGPIHALPEITQ